MDELLNKLIPIFQKVFKKENLVVELSTSAEDIDTWDSLTHVVLLHEIEKTFSIQFELEELISFKTVEDIIKALASKDGV
ncbi:MAG: acyl carrier protein [Vicingaceae bacterium]|nr:acyl carrier protein [Vicingaceae bacterium]